VERILYPKRRLGRLALLVLLWIIVTTGSLRSRGGPMISFVLAIGVIMLAVSLIPAATWLKLDSQGFTVRKWFRQDTYRWSDIKDFRLITYRYMGIIPFRRVVGFTFSRKRNIAARIVGALARFDRLLPDNFGMKPKNLMALMELSRRQAVDVGTGPYAPPANEPEQEVYRRYLQGEIEMRKLSGPQMNETTSSSAAASGHNLLGTDKPSGSQPLSPLGQVMVFLIFFAILTGVFMAALYFYYQVK